MKKAMFIICLIVTNPAYGVSTLVATQGGIIQKWDGEPKTRVGTGLKARYSLFHSKFGWVGSLSLEGVFTKIGFGGGVRFGGQSFFEADLLASLSPADPSEPVIAVGGGHFEGQYLINFFISIGVLTQSIELGPYFGIKF